MSQRLTGERQRRILGIANTGQPIYAIWGADPDPNEQKPDPTVSGGTDPNAPPTAPADPTTQITGAPAGTESARVYTQDEVDQLANRMKAADQNAAQLQQKLRQFEDKDKSELEKATRDLQEQMTAREAAEKELYQLRLHNKFLASNKITWHDPETALALLDTSEVVIEEGGKVVGLEDAITKLAKAKPFLVKEEKSGGGSSGGGRPSGSQPPSNPKGNGKDAAELTRLRQKYPALNR